MTEEEKKQVENLLDFGVMFDKITANARNEVMNSISLPKSSNETIIRPKEIAKRIGCSYTQVMRIMKNKEILKIKISPKIIGTTQASLNAYISERIKQ